MAGATVRQAVPWIKNAMRSRRYFLYEPHFPKRCAERQLNLDDVKNAIENLTKCEPYEGRAPTQGGTNWRVFGPSIDGDEIVVGVEAFEAENELGQCVLLITLFEV